MLIKSDPTELFTEARVASMRWDISPWNLVLDMDSRLSESPNALLHRAWVVFVGLSEISAPFDQSRLPIGFWAYSFWSELKDGFVFSSFSVQFPKFDANDCLVPGPMEHFLVKSKKVIGIRTREGEKENRFRVLDHSARQKLASDADFLKFLLDQQD